MRGLAAVTTSRQLILAILLGLTVVGIGICNDYYTHGTFPSTNSPLSSAGMRSELDQISAGFDKLPALAGNANRVVVVDSSGTKLTVGSGTLTLAHGLTVGGGGSLTLTTSGPSAVTMPTAGTLATINGIETLTNKTIIEPLGITKADVGLGNVDNTSDATKNAATATLTNKELASPIISGTVSGTAVVTPLHRTVTASVDVVNTTTETSAWSTTILANTLGTNRAIKFWIVGDYLNNSGSDKQLTLRLKYGAATIYTHATTLSTSATRRGLWIEGELTGWLSPSTQLAAVRSSVFPPNTTSGTSQGTPSATGSGFGGAINESVGVDSTVNQALSLTYQHDAASASISARLLAVHIQLL